MSQHQFFQWISGFKDTDSELVARNLSFKKSAESCKPLSANPKAAATFKAAKGC